MERPVSTTGDDCISGGRLPQSRFQILWRPEYGVAPRLPAYALSMRWIVITVTVFLLALQACGDGSGHEQRISDLEVQLEEVLSRLDAATTTVPAATTTTGPWGLSADACKPTTWVQFDTC